MPLDPEPVRMVQVKSVRKMDDHGFIESEVETGFVINVYMPHWATCPKAKDFKKG